MSRVAKIKTKNQVKIVTTDGLLPYSKAIQNTFTIMSKRNTKKYGVVHNRVNASKGQGFNIAIERLHNSIRERTKTFRGVHGSIESADAIMQGWEIFYNFIGKHQSLKRCPDELATDLELKNKNK